MYELNLGEKRKRREYRVTDWRDVKFLGRFDCKEFEVRNHDVYRVVICPNFAYIESTGGTRMLLFKGEKLARFLPKRIKELLMDAGFEV